MRCRNRIGDFHVKRHTGQIIDIQVSRRSRKEISAEDERKGRLVSEAIKQLFDTFHDLQVRDGNRTLWDSFRRTFLSSSQTSERKTKASSDFSSISFSRIFVFALWSCGLPVILISPKYDLQLFAHSHENRTRVYPFRSYLVLWADSGGGKPIPGDRYKKWSVILAMGCTWDFKYTIVHLSLYEYETILEVEARMEHLQETKRDADSWTEKKNPPYRIFQIEWNDARRVLQIVLCLFKVQNPAFACEPIVLPHVVATACQVERLFPTSTRPLVNVRSFSTTMRIHWLECVREVGIYLISLSIMCRRCR